MKKFLIPLFSLMLLISTADYSKAQSMRIEEPSGPEYLLDIVFLRPIGLFSTVVGTAFYIVSLPISIPTQRADDAAEKLVFAPYNYTFKRPLGTLK